VNANHSAKLLELLAEYATAYGKDCSPEMTVVELADDLATSLAGEYAPASRPEEWRDAVEDGLKS
jgi:hypothetical protein